MTINPALAVKNPPPAVWRWIVLIAISVAMFGNYYVYDSIGPVADYLQRLLGFSDTQIGTLNAIYSFPNIIMVLVGGIIVDRFGTRAVDARVRHHLPASARWSRRSRRSFPVMAAGRLIFGLGAESMIVAITVAIGQWFVGRQLGFAFGVNLSIARAGSYLADMSTTWFKPFYDARLAAAAVARRRHLTSSVSPARVVYYLLERRADARFDRAAASATGSHRLERSLALRSIVTGTSSASA